MHKKIPDWANCNKCANTYGTLGCCTTISNEWVYSCLDGMLEHAYQKGFKDGQARSKEPKIDLISKHDLCRIIEDNAYWVTYNETSKEKGMTLTGINQALNECPPAEPVRHGKWEMKPDPYGFCDEIPVCSACGCTTKMRETYAYCPNCGAKMDKE